MPGSSTRTGRRSDVPAEVDDIADASSNVSDGPCAWVVFASPSIIAKGCRYRTEAGTSFEIRRYDLAGRPLDPIVIDASMPPADLVVVDTGRGMAYSWDPESHRLLAADLARGGWVTAAPPSDDRSNPEAVDVQGPRPSAGPPTIWSDGRSASGPSVPRTLVGSPDGRLLYATGTGPNEGSSSGIWVFDTQLLQVGRALARARVVRVDDVARGRSMARRDRSAGGDGDRRTGRLGHVRDRA